MTIRLDDDVKDRLDVLADATQRSKSFLAAEAIRAFVETNEWQIGEIQAALKEADAGDFASDKDVAALAKKWKVMRVRWLRTALRNLDEEASFIAADDAVAARLVVDRVLEAVAQLEEQPGLGRPGRVHGTWELVVSKTRFIALPGARRHRGNPAGVSHLAATHRW